MYTKQEAAQLRQTFWTTFGQYMAPILTADGERANWINYKTGERHFAFRMNAVNNTATIGIELSHPDAGLQELYYEQMQELKKQLESHTGEQWEWTLLGQDEHGHIVSKIMTEIDGVNIYKKEDWPQLIQFFKPRLIALDAFWCEAKYFFETLR